MNYLFYHNLRTLKNLTYFQGYFSKINKWYLLKADTQNYSEIPNLNISLEKHIAGHGRYTAGKKRYRNSRDI